MAKARPEETSAGLLMYRFREGRLEVFLAHPGGPYFARKDAGFWGIPKGIAEGGEDLGEAARREFREETGIEPRGPFVPLGSLKLRSGKILHAWAFRGDADPAAISCNTFEIEWPPRSGKRAAFPEIDKACFFPVEEAAVKIGEGQRPLLDRLEEELARRGEG